MAARATDLIHITIRTVENGYYISEGYNVARDAHGPNYVATTREELNQRVADLLDRLEQF